jgi:dihydroorotase
MNPPLRTQSDVDEIIKGLKDGTIDCIASDHAPHSIEEKESEFQFAPNGIVGFETTVGLSFSELFKKNKISIEDLVNKLSINPRKILKIPIPKFETGEVANFTIIDPNLVWTVDVSKFKSKSKNTPFNKKLLTGKSIAVINRKKMLFDDQWINLTSA